jgi:hypothetical protein
MTNERVGLIAATIVNQNPNRKKGAKVYQPGDFFKSATAKKQPKKNPVDQMEAYYKGMMALTKTGAF